jgi:molecular chaperone HscB
MTPFARLGIEEGPWVDGEALEERHRELMARCHPDARPAPGNPPASVEGAATLNEDLAILRDPVRRLQWMLRQQGLTAKTEVPAEGEALFLPLGKWMREVDELKRALRGGGALERAMLAGEAVRLVVEGNLLAERAARGRAQAEADLKELGRTWPAGPDWERLRDIHARLVYLQKWGQQIGERQFVLAGILG